ncbi:MAG: biopolymer transporter ExbD [Deltaproteobacteria bacterium]|nr:MAG: biopolymer transporter ExbD [Deltaproteobacteria bacterium]
MRIETPETRKSRIEMLPLIDIVFLLLVVFIYTMLSMAVHHGLPVTLPTSSVAQIEKNLILSVTVKQDGTVYVDKEQVALDSLAQVLRSKAAGRPNPGVLLFADNALSYQRLFQVLDRIKLAGLNRISLQARVDE